MIDQWRISLSQNLKMLRLMKGISIRSHAKLLGVSPATLCRIENGHGCDLSVLAAISESTGFPVDVLLGVRGKK